MKEKARDLIYLDTKRYISLDMLRKFCKRSIFVPIILVTAGLLGIKHIGICFSTVFPLTSIIIWCILYYMFVLLIQSKKTKKTFELRFLVNGVMGVFFSLLFWILGTSANLIANEPFLPLAFPFWSLLFYLLFSAIYVALIVFGVHKGVYKKIREKSHSPRALLIDGILASIIPITGVLGMIISRSLRVHGSIELQNTMLAIGFVFLLFAPALAHINFVQFYYCKKYGINCDENGDTTSPMLERKPKNTKESKRSKKATDGKKRRMPLFLKILIGIVGVPIAFFVIVFVIAFIRAIIISI